MDCKKKVESNCGIGCYLQKWVFNGIKLENECKISDYGIKDESLIHLMLSLRSGQNSTNYGIEIVEIVGMMQMETMETEIIQLIRCNKG